MAAKMGITITPPGTADPAQRGGDDEREPEPETEAEGVVERSPSEPAPDGDGGANESAEPSESGSHAHDLVCVLGGPGSGKSSQCSRLAGALGYSHLSIGQALKAEAASGSEDAAQIAACTSSGTLVSHRQALSPSPLISS